MLDKRIRFDTRHTDKESGATTLYFTAPAEFLYYDDDADSMMIRLEFPINDIDLVDVAFSPVKNGECYDWFDVRISTAEVEALIKLSNQLDMQSLIKEKTTKRYIILSKGCAFTPDWDDIWGYVTSEELAKIYCNSSPGYYFLEADETHPLYNRVDAFNFDDTAKSIKKREFIKKQEENK